jgi:phage repressor protein C with HTH and peptisase S24 domain
VQQNENAISPTSTLDESPDAVCERIKSILQDYLRKKRVSTQGEFAALVKIQPAALSNILKGKKSATPKQLRSIEAATRVRFEWLATGEQPVEHPIGWVPISEPVTKEGEFFRQFVADHKRDFTQAGLAKRLDVAKSTITDYFTTAVFDVETKNKIVAALQDLLPDEQLSADNIFSSDSPSWGDRMRPIGNFSSEPVIELPFVPVRARAGIPTARYWEHPPETTRIMRATLMGYEPDPAKPRRSWWVIEIDGDSMEPQLNSRARVLGYYVDKEQIEYLKPGVWAIQYDDEFVIKRIRTNQLEREGGLLLHSDNPPPDPFFIKANSIRHVWFIETVVDGKVR